MGYTVRQLTLTGIKQMKTPPIKELSALFIALKPQICTDSRATEADTKPSMQVTIGRSTDGSWSYQTGDNNYKGVVYSYPHWAVVSLYKNSNCRTLAKNCIQDLLNSYNC